MHRLEFSSADPLDHVCRALDAIRKLGFGLASVRVDATAEGTFHVSISFHAPDPFAVGTLLERVSSCVGVYDLTHGAERACPARG